MPSGLTAERLGTSNALDVATPISTLESVDKGSALATSLVFRTLAHPLRLQIISHLYQRGPTSRANLTAAVGENWSKMEHHLKVLTADGFVLMDGEGLESMYRLRDDLLPRIARLCSPSDL